MKTILICGIVVAGLLVFLTITPYKYFPINQTSNNFGGWTMVRINRLTGTIEYAFPASEEWKRLAEPSP